MKRPELGWRGTSRFRSAPLCKSVVYSISVDKIQDAYDASFLRPLNHLICQDDKSVGPGRSCRNERTGSSMDAETHFLLDYDGGSPRESTRFIACVACRALRKHLHAVLWQASSARCYFPRRDAQRMAIQTRFTKKLTRSADCNDRFLALLGNDRELDLALLDVKNRVRTLSL
jgi:hypothetical protein